MRWIRNLPNSTTFWLVIGAIVLACSIGLPAAKWGWLRSGASEGQSGVTTESTGAAESSGPTESNSTTVRNIGFIVAGVLALVFAVWRGVLAQRQAKTAEAQARTALRQSRTAQRQADTAQQGLLNERYQRGAEMLGNEVLSVRLGGVYALQTLAEEHPEQYHVHIMRLFCAFARNPTGKADDTVLGYFQDGRPVPGIREDVQAVMDAIGSRTDADIALERDDNYTLGLQNAKLQHVHLASLNLSGVNLAGADLSGAVLEGTNLSNAFLFDSILSYANLDGAILSNASLGRANLSGAILLDAILSDANLDGAILPDAFLNGADLADANLTGASFSSDQETGQWSPATGLTQAQLDVACSDPDNPPDLEGVLDADGNQLVWQGRPCEEESEES